MEPLDPSFYERDTRQVARDLLGHYIHAPTPNGDDCIARIVETEAYLGPEDPGSHAQRGKDTQAHRLWGPPGIAYVYICYGIHQMLNVVAHAPGDIGAVLIRAADPLQGEATMQARRGTEQTIELCSGPGKLAQALGITRDEHDGVDLTEPSGLYLARGEAIPDDQVATTGRIGLSQGGDLPLRYVNRGAASLSRPAPRSDA